LANKSHSHVKRTLGVLAAGAISLGFVATPGHAQSYNDDVSSYQSDMGEIVVRPPHRGRERSAIGAPIEDVYVSRAVPYDDLDLTTDDGADELRARVTQAAYSACEELDEFHPVAANDSPPCESTTTRDGLRKARYAIERARGW
jgi:UrcA family protein